jgi:glycerophosphoryl diester phosphodiesterase
LSLVRSRLRAPLVVAHRVGNDLRHLRTSELPIVEADVHFFRGRLEVRHLKTLGPVPVYWDRWQLPRRFRPRVVLADVFAAAPPATTLLLDLKGTRRRLASAVLEALGDRRAIVCSRNWRHLEPFRDVEQVAVAYSVGSRRQLSALRRLVRRERLAGISIHERLLDARTAAELTERADLVLTWPVNTLERARELVSWGVRGLITDDPEALEPLTA